MRGKKALRRSGVRERKTGARKYNKGKKIREANKKEKDI
jgi:hypothetical protein